MSRLPWGRRGAWGRGVDSDEKLISRFLGGDERAFEELVERYEVRVRNLAFGFVRDHALAEDIAQDAFIRAYRKASSFRAGGAFRSWLYRIAINRAQDELRRIRRRVEVPIEEELDGSAEMLRRSPPLVEELAATRELGRAIATALAGLRPQYRVPLVLREVEGMTYSEIARLLGWPLGTVQVRIHRGRLELRARLRHFFSRGETKP